MSIERLPGEYIVDPEETALFSWLETDLRDTQKLIDMQRDLRQKNPVLYHIIADASYELAPDDLYSRGTYFGSFLLLVSEMAFNRELAGIG